MKQPRISEKEITFAIRSLLNVYGIWHWKHFGGPMGAKGVSDILGCYKGRFLAIEVKTPGGRTSPEQERFLANVNDAGGIAFVAHSIYDVIEKLELKKGSYKEYQEGKG